MAPRRSGGYYSNGSSSICPDAFVSSAVIAYFVAYCLYFFVCLGVLAWWLKVRKTGAGAKKLLGGVFASALVFELIHLALLISATVAYECDVPQREKTYYSLVITYTIYARLAHFFLLVVAVWGVNSLLRSQLAIASNPTTNKHSIVYKVVLGFMGLLTIGLTGLSTYNNWFQLHLYTNYDATGMSLIYEEVKLGIAYYALYLVIVIGSGVLSFKTLMQLKKRGHLTAKSIIPYCLLLTFSMAAWTLLYIIDYAVSLAGIWIGHSAYTAIVYLEYFFQAMSFIALLLIAKKAVAFKSFADGETYVHGNANGHWGLPEVVPGYDQQQQPQYGYTYQDPPAYAGQGVVR